jgi:hypothetical protein
LLQGSRREAVSAASQKAISHLKCVDGHITQPKRRVLLLVLWAVAEGILEVLGTVLHFKCWVMQAQLVLPAAAAAAAAEVVLEVQHAVLRTNCWPLYTVLLTQAVLVVECPRCWAL